MEKNIKNLPSQGHLERLVTAMMFLGITLTAMAQTKVTADATKLLQVKEQKLQNGMTVWINEDHSRPQVYGAVVVRAGAKDCPNTGIAHYFEHIMFKGTQRLGTTDYEAERPWLDSIAAQYDLLSQTTDDARRTDIQKHINELSLKAADYVIPNEFNRLAALYGGSQLNAATSYDMTFYHNLFLPQFVEQWCMLNSERLMNPVFRGFQGELENVYEEKNRSADNMFGNAQEVIFEKVFKTQPYAYPILGSTESLKNPRLSEMAAFFKEYYVASNMCLILCGDITPSDELTALLERTFGRVQTGPVPARKHSPMPTIGPNEMHEVKLAVPIIGMEGKVWAAPTNYEADAEAMSLANRLLSNGKAGRLDSLVNENKLMMALATNVGLDDAAGNLLFIVPRPLAKMKKAEAAVMAEVQHVIDGDFTEQQLTMLKRELAIGTERALEDLDTRASMMISAYSSGHTWADVMGKLDRINSVTKEQVMVAAKKYYGANCVTFKKKYGNPTKEHLKQPGYKPIQPKNVDAQSALAQELEKVPVSDCEIKTIDLEADVTKMALNPHINLYYKENPLNDIFSLTLRFWDGRLHTPILKQLDAYLGSIGTDSLTKQQLERAWQRLNVTMTNTVSNGSFEFSLTGDEHQLSAALSLLAHFLTHPKGNDEALKDIKSTDKVDRKGFGEEKDDVLSAMVERICFGSRSSFLNQLSKKEVKELTSARLLQALNELMQYDCDLYYTGRMAAQDVAQLLMKELPLSRCQRPKVDTFRPLDAYAEPTVFFYHVPNSRQNYVGSYDLLRAMPTPEARAEFQLWGNYFGGGMSSVIFQNVREFRSMAYSTQGVALVQSLALHPDASPAYITLTGTQADKTLDVMAVVDSLLRDMPMKEQNFRASRQNMLNDIQTGYPTFRELPKSVANLRMEGYQQDPNKALAEAYARLTSQDIVDFHKKNLATNTRVWIIIGDKKKCDFAQLAKYGRVVELQQEDVMR